MYTFYRASVRILGALLAAVICTLSVGCRHEAGELPAIPGGREDQELLAAADRGDVAGVRALLKNGANPNFQSRSDRTGVPPLVIAAQRGHTEVVRILLEAGARVEGRLWTDETALYAAAWRGHLDTVRLLLEWGANVQVRVGTSHLDADADAVSKAIAGGHAKVAWLLLAAGAEVRPDHVCVAIEGGHVDVIDVLLRVPIEAHAIRCDGRSPLEAARRLGSPQGDEIAARLSGKWPDTYYRWSVKDARE